MKRPPIDPKAEKALMIKTLVKAKFSMCAIARALGVTRQRLYQIMKEEGL
jgi:DNA-binding phage protein